MQQCQQAKYIPCSSSERTKKLPGVQKRDKNESNLGIFSAVSRGLHAFRIPKGDCVHLKDYAV